MIADEEAIDLLARRAGGSMRDAQSLLDQCLAYAGGRLTVEKVRETLGISGEEHVFALAQAILSGDAAAGLKLVESAVAAGIQLGEWVEQTLEFFRDLLALYFDPSVDLLSMPDRLRREMLDRIEGLTPEMILERMDLLAACRLRMRGGSFGRALLEMTVVRLCRLDQFLNLAGVAVAPAGSFRDTDQLPNVGGPSRLLDAGRSPPSITVPTPVQNATPSIASTPKVTPPSISLREPNRSFVAATSASFNGPNDVAKPTVAKPDVPPESAAIRRVDCTAESAIEFWRVVRASLPAGEVVLKAALDRCSPVYGDPNVLTLTFAKTDEINRAYCDKPSSLSLLGTICNQVAGRSIILKTASINNETRDGSSSRPIVESPTRVKERLKPQATASELVRAARKTLGASLIDVFPLKSEESTAKPANEPSVDQVPDSIVNGYADESSFSEEIE
jgi:DNA polymerase-3 subunit gamma/tau